MKPSAAFGAKLSARALQYTRRALALKYDYPETTIPLSELEAALLEAYKDGARDVYALIDNELAPLWELAGLE